MTTNKMIQLTHKWHIGEPLDSGGFAQVYEASGDDGTVAVAKMIPKEPGAERELLFESLEDTINVIPILDFGEIEDKYILIMPRADTSLRKYLAVHGNQLDQNEAIQILENIASSLESLSVTVVHRDLKPENVLKYKGTWCLADFGIARYAGATTSPDTHKFSMTQPYASPEQWRYERATHATDIYAFGVIAFELLEGTRPFNGPDFRDQHLNQTPPRMTKASASLASLVSDCLSKAPAARPTATNVIRRLQNSRRQATPSIAALQQVNQRIAEKQVEESAKDSARRSIEEMRAELFVAGKHTISRIIEDIVERVSQAAPASQITRQNGMRLSLGQAILTIEDIQSVAPEVLAIEGNKAPFDIIAQTTIQIKKPQDIHHYEGRGHSLWYCDAYEEGVYRWYETAFMYHPRYPMTSFSEPFSLPVINQDIVLSFSPFGRRYQIAWDPLPFDQGDEEQFIERWMNWFAVAAEGNLTRPRSMPERSGGHYRR